jgi:hypothetical protein
LGIEAHGIKPLRILASADNHRVGKDVSAMQALVDADVSRAYRDKRSHAVAVDGELG